MVQVRFEREPTPPPERPVESWVRVALGASLVRPVWGWAPNDWGIKSVSALVVDPCAPKSRQPEASRSVKAKEKKVHKAHGHAHGKPKGFWQLPRRRHNWGESQYELHASWAGKCAGESHARTCRLHLEGVCELAARSLAYCRTSTLTLTDLFHDLIYVGAAYQIGDVVKYSFYSCDMPSDSYPSGSSSSSGSGSSSGRLLADASSQPTCVGLFFGVFYSMALFQCLVRHWMTDLFLHNRFEASDLAHRLWDCITYLAVASAASGILPVHQFLDIGPWTFDVPMITALILLILRYVELALLSPDRAVRRATAQMATDLGVVFAFWASAILLYPQVNWAGTTQQPIGDGGLFGPGTEEIWEPGLLLLAGGLAIEARMLWRTQRLSWFCSREQALYYIRHDFPRDKVSLPINIEFTIHRLNEFMMLMLGETILSITISTIERSALKLHYVTFAAGFFICLCMTFSFNVTEPHHSAHHVLRRDSTAGLAWLMCFGLKAFSVLQVGIGIKIALLDPDAEWSIHVKKAQWHLAGSNALCFGMVLLMRPLHGGFKRFYSRKAFRESPRRLYVFVCYLVALALTVGISFIRMRPWQHVLALALADVGFVLLVNITISTDKKVGHHHDGKPDVVTFDVTAMQLKKFRGTSVKQSARDSVTDISSECSCGTDAAAARQSGAEGVFASLTLTGAADDPPWASTGSRASTGSTAARTNARGGASLLAPSQRSRNHGSSVSASESGTVDGGSGRAVGWGGVLSRVRTARALRPRGNFNDAGGEMGLFGVVTTATLDGPEPMASSEALHERMPDRPEEEERWRLVSETLRKLHLLAKHLRDPFDPRVDVQQFIEELAQSESMPPPPLTEASLQAVQRATASLGHLFGLEEQEQQLHTILER